MPARTGLKGYGVIAALAFSLAGCETPIDTLALARAVVPEGLTSDRQLPLRPWTPESHPVPGKSGHAAYAERLSLGEAVKRTLTFNPAVKAAFLEIEAKHGEEAQASFKPNPELLLEVENFAGSKGNRGFESAEETLSINQTIELGDKRLKRLRAAHLDASLAGWDYETVRLQTALQAAQTFMDVLASQERLTVLRGFVAIAERTNSSVDARINAGRASPIEGDRSMVVLARARALVRAEQVRLDEAKRMLATLWGSEQPNFGRAEGRLGRNRAVPSMDRLKAYLEENPALARWSDGVGHRLAQLDLERAKSLRDIKVGAGVRRFNEDDSVAVVASISVPVQLFDKNTGAVAAAERRVLKAEQEQNAARTQLVGSLVEALGALRVAATQLSALESEVLPAAERAFDRTQIGFNEGRFDILNVLDAQRTVFEARLERVNAQAEYEKSRVRVEAIIGRDLSSLR